MTSGTKTDLSLYLILLKYVSPYKWYFAVAAVGMVIFSSTNAGIAMLVKPLLDEAQMSEGTVIAVWIPFSIIGVLIARSVGQFLSTYFLGVVTTSALREMRNDLFQRLLHSTTSFYDAHDHGKLISRITHVTSSVGNLVTSIVLTTIRDSLTLILLIAWMIYLNWVLTLIFVSVMPIVLYILRKTKGLYRKLSGQSFVAMGDLTNITNQAITGEEVIKSYSGYDYAYKAFKQSNEDLAKRMRRLLRVKSISIPLIMLLVGSSSALIIYLFTFDTVTQWISLSELMSFLTAGLLIPKPAKGLANVYASIHSSLSGVKLLAEVFNAPLEAPFKSLASHTAPPTCERLRGDIKIENLSMSYDAVRHGLSSVSLHIKPGEHLALVGRSGAGKTTLVRLLMRFYNPDSGRILADDKDIADMNIHDWRTQVSYVGQQVILFQDTIKKNIAFQSEIDEDRIRQVVEQAHVSQFVDKLPEGLDTKLGPGQTSLSGGEKQRIALARCLYKDAPIIIFDEVTSALDTQAEMVIKDTIQNLLRDRTCIIIAHRFSTISEADRVAVLDNGHLVEEGTHSELLEAGGVYKELYDPSNRILM